MVYLMLLYNTAVKINPLLPLFAIFSSKQISVKLFSGIRGPPSEVACETCCSTHVRLKRFAGRPSITKLFDNDIKWSFISRL